MGRLVVRSSGVTMAAVGMVSVDLRSVVGHGEDWNTTHETAATAHDINNVAIRTYTQYILFLEYFH